MNFVEDVLERNPAARPALISLSEDGERYVWAYGELIARSAGIAGAMLAAGVGRGEVVMTLTGSRPEWVLTMLACFRIGVVALPCNPQLRRADLAHRAAVADPALAIGEERYLAELPDGVPHWTLEELGRILDEDRRQPPAAAPAALEPTDPALIVFTSGTTGEGRAALHPQSYLMGNRTMAESWLGARPGEISWCTAAPGWSKSARNTFIAPWLVGAVPLIEESRFDPARRLATARNEGVSVLCQSPTEYRMLAKGAELRPAEGLRRMVSAGEPLNPEVIEAFREYVGLPIHDGYGQTETGHLVGTQVGMEVRPGSMGKPLPGIGLDLADDGELLLRPGSCPTFFSGYLGEPPFDGEWWHTGDHVRTDDDGYLWFEGRGDDVIISSGYRIGPFEVESALVSHPAVAEAAVVAAPDEERGSVVRAVVVLRGGEGSPELAGELQEHVRSRTAPYKYPRIVEFADELPKTPSGKIRRSALRAAPAGHEPAA